MEIEHCVFPDNLYYDLDDLIWVRREKDNVLVTGITSILSALAGKISAITLKEVNTVIEKGKSTGTIESSRFFGVVRAPVAGRIIAINHELLGNPKLANDSPYGNGWFVVLEPSSGGDNDIEKQRFKALPQDSEEVGALIRRLRVKCYSALPDFEMTEIGIECAATLLKLDDLISHIDNGQVIHVLSDDPTADIEMTRWSEDTGQQLVEIRKEDNLLHFIVRKVR
ncbi:MAG TPA: sulfurtransferase TusA family protein [Nitrososphaeraceae archaeon]|nr:sulfurtransferase TusA family protein [Nitrososphaeraceae archaeon]